MLAGPEGRRTKSGENKGVQIPDAMLLCLCRCGRDHPRCESGVTDPLTDECGIFATRRSSQILDCGAHATVDLPSCLKRVSAERLDSIIGLRNW